MRSRYAALLGAGFLCLAFPPLSAQAGTVLVFGQNGVNTDFTATNNGSNGASGGTKLSAVDIAITITGIANSSPLPASFPSAFFNLTAVSVSNAVLDGSGHITQDFSGSFSITELAGGAGMNYLSGVFQDTVFGNGTGLTLTGSGPIGVPGLSSDGIAALAQLRAISLSFTDVTPAAFITGNNTLGAFSSNISGNFSAAVPEPGSFALLAISATSVLLVRRRFVSLPRNDAPCAPTMPVSRSVRQLPA